MAKMPTLMMKLAMPVPSPPSPQPSPKGRGGYFSPGGRGGNRRYAYFTLSCAWLGLELDATANAAHGPRISAPQSTVSAWVIPTDEEVLIARRTLEVLGAAGYGQI